MADDTELRARIEAQIAARRAAQSRPPADRQEPPTVSPAPSPSRLQPIKPWAGKDGTEPRRNGVDTSGVAPSNPDVVLRGLVPVPEKQATTPASPPESEQTRRGIRGRFTRVARHAGTPPPGPSPAPSPGPSPVPPPTPEPMPQPTPEPMPQPTPEPVPQPTPEPVPQPTPEPVPQPTPDPLPPPASNARPVVHSPRPRPRPGTADTPQPPTAGRPSPTPAKPAPSNEVSLAKPPITARPRAPRPRPRAGTASAEPASDPAPAGQAVADPEHRPLDLGRLIESSRRKLSTEPDEDDKAPAEQAGRRSAVLGRLLRIAVLVGIAATAALLLRAFVVAPYYIPSGSMEPTLHGCPTCNDDHILIDKISYRFHAPQQSDIVVFSTPPRSGVPDKVLVKRVIGLPGQHLALRHGYVYINGRRLQEPYLNRAFLRKECGPGGQSTPETGRSRWTIPAGDVFVMGDNRCNSTDSRVFGPIPESSIIGRAFAIIWPLGRIRFL